MFRVHGGNYNQVKHMLAVSTGEGQVHKGDLEVKCGGFCTESDVWVFV